MFNTLDSIDSQGIREYNQSINFISIERATTLKGANNDHFRLQI